MIRLYLRSGFEFGSVASTVLSGALHSNSSMCCLMCVMVALARMRVRKTDDSVCSIDDERPDSDVSGK